MTIGTVIALIKALGGGGGSGGGGVLVVTATESGGVYTCNKTAAEMASAFISGGLVICVPGAEGFPDTYSAIVSAEWSEGADYTFYTNQMDGYEALTGDDYPTFEP